MSNAISARGLVKHYGSVRAIDGVDLDVEEGTVVGLLGPNGAGKTTTVKVLATLLKPDAGTATVNGFDVVKDADAVRAQIGLTGQYAAVDEYLTGRENLTLFGKLFHLDKQYVKERAAALLDRFDLADAADRPIKTYSGGMRRRLDLAASLIGHPKVLFLDEPTTGLDPRSRLGMWDVIQQLVREGTTVLLTTQYLEEADQLASKIVVIDHGKVIAEGTADQLKSRIGGDRVELQVPADADVTAASNALTLATRSAVMVDGRRLMAPVSNGSAALVDVVRAFDGAGIHLEDIALRRPTLDDVFLALTGHAAEESA